MVREAGEALMGFLPHWMVTCRGPEFKREYIPPHKFEFEGDAFHFQMIRDEATYGVTLVHHRCRTCGKHFVNRELGDTRDAGQAG